MAAQLSPMMQQWAACKQKAGQALLLFRLGDFYEAFEEDAKLLSDLLDLTLTKRQEIPMAGVPVHSVENYIEKLIEKGLCIAIAEQLEDPQTVKGLVKRDITRIITPATLIEAGLIKDHQNNYLAALTRNNQFGLVLADITTAEIHCFEFEDAQTLLNELTKWTPKELLVPKAWQDKMGSWLAELKQHLPKCLCHFKSPVQNGSLPHNLKNHLHGKLELIEALHLLFDFLQTELRLPTMHLCQLSLHEQKRWMLIDRNTQRNLELLRPLQEDQVDSTLLSFLDRTATPMGARLLKKWVIHPLLDQDRIEERQAAIRELIEHDLPIHKKLKAIRDLERMMMRIETGFASPRDLYGLYLSLAQVPPLKHILQALKTPFLNSCCNQLIDLSALCTKIESALIPDPPIRLNDGDLFKPGFSSELDSLKELKKSGYDWIARYQTTLRETTGIKTLKVGYTKAFGYYIEVSRGALEKIPNYFERRQTLVGGERYVTQELKEFEYRIVQADAQIEALQAELFQTLRREVASFALEIRQISVALAKLDCLCALSEVARAPGWSQPSFTQDNRLEMRSSFHPVVSSHLPPKTFIVNDLLLEADIQLALITGPNMAGKSTYIRQIALIAILAQMGSFVPASKAKLPLFDHVFSRIGASDNLAKGESTFMVEMSETAAILREATDHSLIILDEIGRGTSTYDGVAIAWAVAEYLLTEKGKKAKTLFATHYYELTELAEQFPAAINLSMSVAEEKEEVIFFAQNYCW